MKASTSGPNMICGTGQSFPKKKYFFTTFYSSSGSVQFNTRCVFLDKEDSVQRRCTVLRTSIKDSRRQGTLALLQRWASSKSAGRAGDRGNQAYQRSPDHILKTAPSRNQRDKLCERQRRGKVAREETGEQWRSGYNTTAALTAPGGSSKVCWSHGLFLKLIDKNKAQFPHWPFPCCRSCCIFILLLYIYTPLVKPFPLWNCARLPFLIFVDVQLVLFQYGPQLYSGLSTLKCL